jgi:hypothetical protein
MSTAEIERMAPRMMDCRFPSVRPSNTQDRRND